jgi:hypothetical protein
MSRVYVINVGANAKDSSIARSPIFADGTFEYVSFPTNSPEETEYSGIARAFVRDPNTYRTHADPDWVSLTYGDYCANPRARALTRVARNDVLLFWGMLWRNIGVDWASFTGERGWYLLGALRVEEILRFGRLPAGLPEESVRRALLNAHFGGGNCLDSDHHVFIGHKGWSRRFERAVDLGVESTDGLVYRAFASANGDALTFNGKPSWNSSLRSCRAMWNLDVEVDRGRAQLVRDAIRAKNHFDLLDGL